MKHKMYSIYDGAAGAYLPPFVMHADAMAARAFGDCVNSKDHQFGQHPEDYTLFRVGGFDDNKGLMTAEVPQTMVTNGLMALKRDLVGAGNGELFPQLTPTQEALLAGQENDNA